MRDGVTASCVSLPNVATSQTVFEFLCQRFPFVAADVWRQRLHAGEVVSACGVAVQSGDVLGQYTGQKLFYYRVVPDEVAVPFQAAVLYQDAHLLVADKPHFLPVMPAGSYLQETLLVRLRREFDLPELAPLHRIDRETAGLVLFSKQLPSRGIYQGLFRERSIHKQYEAIAAYDAQMAFPREHCSRMVEVAGSFRMAEDTSAGAEPNSHTHMQLLEHNRVWARYGLSPISGRKHQLRVHMAALGLPLQGDSMYPVAKTVASGDYSQPLQLLAKSVRFTDPLTQLVREFTSQQALLPLPGVD